MPHKEKIGNKKRNCQSDLQSRRLDLENAVMNKLKFIKNKCVQVFYRIYNFNRSQTKSRLL